jgi:hypothetical protein
MPTMACQFEVGELLLAPLKAPLNSSRIIGILQRSLKEAFNVF